MFFFNSPKPTIESLSFPTFDWKLDKADNFYRSWINESNTVGLYLNFFEKYPDLPTINDVTLLRQFYRNSLVQSNGGIVELEIMEKNGIKIIKSIFKISREPQLGFIFLGSFVIPFRDYSYVIKIQAGEIGDTGYREAVILSEYMQNNKVQTDDGKLINWFFDPYDSAIHEGVLMCKADLPEYDERFSMHPLSEVRKRLQQIIDSLEFKKEIQKLKPFEK